MPGADTPTSIDSAQLKTRTLLLATPGFYQGAFPLKGDEAARHLVGARLQANLPDGRGSVDTFGLSTGAGYDLEGSHSSVAIPLDATIRLGFGPSAVTHFVFAGTTWAPGRAEAAFTPDFQYKLQVEAGDYLVLSFGGGLTSLDGWTFGECAPVVSVGVGYILATRGGGALRDSPASEFK